MAWQAQALIGQHITLQPLAQEHFEPLWTVAQHESIWRFMPFPAGTRPEFNQHLEVLLSQRDKAEAMPFVTINSVSGELIGATSFLAISEFHRRLEIGSTWITPEHQRSAVNTEAKLLQLTDAFERLNCNRVELKTDSLNERSQAAILRWGAQYEGTFRNHMVLPDGRLRHTKWYSITRDEWPSVKAGLEAKLKN